MYPWQNYPPYNYPPPPPNSPVQFIPYPVEGKKKSSKRRRDIVDEIAKNIEVLEKLKKTFEKKDEKKDDKPKEINWNDFFKEVGKIMTFGPPLAVLYYEIGQHFLK